MPNYEETLTAGQSETLPVTAYYIDLSRMGYSRDMLYSIVSAPSQATTSTNVNGIV
jgi:hypothetical protein